MNTDYLYSFLRNVKRSMRYQLFLILIEVTSISQQMPPAFLRTKEGKYTEYFDIIFISRDCDKRYTPDIYIVKDKYTWQQLEIRPLPKIV